MAFRFMKWLYVYIRLCVVESISSLDYASNILLKRKTKPLLPDAVAENTSSISRQPTATHTDFV